MPTFYAMLTNSYTLSEYLHATSGFAILLIGFGYCSHISTACVSNRVLSQDLIGKVLLSCRQANSWVSIMVSIKVRQNINKIKWMNHISTLRDFLYKCLVITFSIVT